MNAADLALLTGGEIKRPKLKRRFTRLTLSGMKPGSKHRASDFSQDKKGVSWGKKVTHINHDGSIVEDIQEFE